MLCLNVTSIYVCLTSLSLQDLDIGVKDLRVSVDGVMVFEGQLDKGCGNNVFDYSCTIPLHTPPSDCQQSASFVEETPLSISTVDDGRESGWSKQVLVVI